MLEDDNDVGINFNDCVVYKLNYHPVTPNTFVRITLDFKAVEIFTCETGRYTLLIWFPVMLSDFRE